MCSLEAIEGTVSKVLGLRVLGSTPVSGSGVYWGLRFTADGFRSDKQEPGACGFRLNSTKKSPERSNLGPREESDRDTKASLGTGTEAEEKVYHFKT